MYGSFHNKDIYYKREEDDCVDVKETLLKKKKNNKNDIRLTSSTSKLDCDGKSQSRSDSIERIRLLRNLSFSSGPTGHLWPSEGESEETLSILGQEADFEVDQRSCERHYDECEFSHDDRSIRSNEQMVDCQSVPNRVIRTVDGVYDINGTDVVVHSDIDRDSGHDHIETTKCDVCNGDESICIEHTDIPERPRFTIGDDPLSYNQFHSIQNRTRGKHGSFDSSREVDCTQEQTDISSDENEENDEKRDNNVCKGKYQNLVHEIRTRSGNGKWQIPLVVLLSLIKETRSSLPINDKDKEKKIKKKKDKDQDKKEKEEEKEENNDGFVTIPLTPSSSESNIEQQGLEREEKGISDTLFIISILYYIIMFSIAFYIYFQN